MAQNFSFTLKFALELQTEFLISLSSFPAAGSANPKTFIRL